MAFTDKTVQPAGRCGAAFTSNGTVQEGKRWTRWSPQRQVKEPTVDMPGIRSPARWRVTGWVIGVDQALGEVAERGLAFLGASLEQFKAATASMLNRFISMPLAWPMMSREAGALRN